MEILTMEHDASAHHVENVAPTDGGGGPGRDAAIERLSVRPAGERELEVRDNLLRLRELMTSGPDRSEAAALRWRRNFSWLTAGGDSHVDAADPDGVATLLVTRHEAVVLTTVIEAARMLEEELSGLGLEVIALPWHRPQDLATEIRRRAGDRVARDEDLEPSMAWLRAELCDAEQARLRSLALDTSRAVTDAFAGLRPGDSEFDAAARLAYQLLRRGVAAPVILAAADDRISRYRHPIPTLRPIDKCLMLVAVGERGGLHAAVSRMAWLRGEPGRDLQDRYAAAARIHSTLTRSSRPGASLASALVAGFEAYRREGFPDEWRLHHQGGVIGYKSREVVATPSVEGHLLANMALAWNPSITGTKVEETILINDMGEAEVLTLDLRWPTVEGVAGIGLPPT
jgi:Xaa-Pro aminopeptidase